MKSGRLFTTQGRVLEAVILAFCLTFNCVAITYAQLPQLREKGQQIVPPTANNGLIAAPAPQVKNDSSDRAHINEISQKLPITFEVNRGQADAGVNFLSRIYGYDLFLTANEAILALHDQNHSNAVDNDSVVLRMKLIGANRAARARGINPMPGKSNYLFGNDPQKWCTNVDNYARIEYQDIYPGVKLAYYGNQRQLEYDFIIAPGANPNRIGFAFTGAQELRIDDNGDLVINTGKEEIRQHKPFAYQLRNGHKEEIACHYTFKQNHEVSFQLGHYDRSRELVIDPTLVYSTYLGGNSGDAGTDIAIDSVGNIYVVGRTDSLNFPTRTPIQMNNNGNGDIFVSKFNPSGSTLIFSSYFGGSGDEIANSVAVDSMGNIYLAGATRSGDFPITSGALQRNPGVGVDGFVAKLNATGTQLIYSTFLGGSGDDLINDLTIDSNGNVYVTGSTRSTDLPVTPNAFRPANGGFRDAFVSKINTTGSMLIISTYLGGNTDDGGNALAIDTMGNIYVTGSTKSPDFPVTTGAFQSMFVGGSPNSMPGGDVFITKLNPTGTMVIYSTYLGGLDDEFGVDLVLDAANNAYVAGLTRSMDFPTQNPFQRQNNGGPTLSIAFDAFVTKLNPAGTVVLYSTYLGGNDFDVANNLALDRAGNLYIVGSTASTNFPIMDPLQGMNQSLNNDTDIFVAKLNPTGNMLDYSTYMGGTNIELGDGIVVDANGTVFITGTTVSTNFPVTATAAFQSQFGGGGIGLTSGDAFIAQITDPIGITPDYSISLSPATATVTRGKNVQITVNIDRSLGFTGNVTITPSGGKKLAFKPTSGATTQANIKFTIKAKMKAKLGPQQIVFTASDDNARVRTATLTLTVQ
ncbi:MAG: SBBP repeat-containing protein [Acidobacteriota bacterium]